MKPKSSFIWNFYDEVESDRAKCKICDNVYSRKGRCTTGLITHLKLKHNDEYLKFVDFRDKLKESVAISTPKSSLTPLQAIKKQVTLQESLHRKDYWDSSYTKAIEFDKLIAEMIALQDLPFNFVEGIGFRRFLQAALPRYKLRGREYFTSFLCENLYDQMACKIKQLLEDFNKISFTSDIWSDPSASVSLLSLTAHGIAEDFRKVNIILKCEPIEGSHTGVVISEKFILMLNEWNLTEKVHCVVRNRGSNMIRAMNLSNFTHIDCTVHQIQLCVRAGIESEDYLLKIIEKSKKIATHFNHSILAQDELHKIQTQQLNQPSLAVIQDCPTRWNSTYYMMERLLKIKDSIILYLSTYNKITVSTDEWLDMEKCVAVLKPFEEITQELSSTKILISSIIPLIHVLKLTLQEEECKTDTSVIFKRMIKKLIKELNSRFGELHNNNTFAIATYLDPRYKLKFFNEILKEKIQSDLCLIYFESISDNSPLAKKLRMESLSDNDNDDKRTTSHTMKNSSQIQSSLANLLNSNSDDEVEDDRLDRSSTSNTYNRFPILKSLLIEYNKDKKLQLTEDPLLWWKFNSNKYKDLIPIVRQFLATPPGSVPSEQLFSGASLIYDPLRNKLKGEKAAKLLFVKYNLPLLNFEY